MDEAQRREVIWRKSSFSADAHGNCVEAGVADQIIVVRDSKDPNGPILRFTRTEWELFLHAIRVAKVKVERGEEHEG